MCASNQKKHSSVDINIKINITWLRLSSSSCFWYSASSRCDFSSAVSFFLRRNMASVKCQPHNGSACPLAPDNCSAPPSLACPSHAGFSALDEDLGLSVMCRHCTHSPRCVELFCVCTRRNGHLEKATAVAELTGPKLAPRKRQPTVLVFKDTYAGCPTQHAAATAQTCEVRGLAFVRDASTV
jgi:hypothetical protein